MHPPNLKCAMMYDGWTPRHVVYRGGAYRVASHRRVLLFVAALMLNLSHLPNAAEIRERLKEANEDHERWLQHLPLKSFPPLEDFAWFFEHVGHPDDGPYWQEKDALERANEFEIPTTQISGWFDFDLHTPIRAFSTLRRLGRTKACRNG